MGPVGLGWQQGPWVLAVLGLGHWAELQERALSGSFERHGAGSLGSAVGQGRAAVPTFGARCPALGLSHRRRPAGNSGSRPRCGGEPPGGYPPAAPRSRRLPLTAGASRGPRARRGRAEGRGERPGVRRARETRSRGERGRRGENAGGSGARGSRAAPARGGRRHRPAVGARGGDPRRRP